MENFKTSDIIYAGLIGIGAVVLISLIIIFWYVFLFVLLIAVIAVFIAIVYVFIREAVKEDKPFNLDDF